jgi:RND family efflux transporter MFP subunit
VTKSFIGRIGWSVVVLVGVAAAGFGAREGLAFHDSASAQVVPDRPAQPVRVTCVSLAVAEGGESFTGVLRPNHEAPLAFRLPGLLVARLVDVGDRVTAGQVIARLDDTDARLEMETAQAERDASKIDLARASSAAARSARLFAEGHLPQAALDQANSAAAEAQSRADRAARALHLASNRLTYMELSAPSGGIVTQAPAEVGQVVAAGQNVISIASEGAMDVVFAIPEQSRDLVQTAGASAVLWGDEGQDYALSLRDISPDVDPVGRTYRVRMRLDAPDASAALGRTATVRLARSDAAPVAVLPLAAVVNDGQGAAVWRLVGPDRVERVLVEVVSVDGAAIRVRGLTDGDQVVSLGAAHIDPARPVRVVETATHPES